MEAPDRFDTKLILKLMQDAPAETERRRKKIIKIGMAQGNLNMLGHHVALAKGDADQQRRCAF